MDPKRETPRCSKIVTVWSEDETKILLEKYAKFIPDVGHLKLFRHKKNMWIRIAADFNGKSWRQCEERYKTVMKRKKRKSADAKIQLHKDLEPIFKIEVDDDFIEPPIKERVGSGTQMKVQEKTTEEKQKTLQETLLEIAARKKEAKERRHKEKMERADRIAILLEKLIRGNS